MAILTWDGSQYREIAGLQAGDAPAQHAYVWDGSQYVVVWSAWSDSGITKVGTQQLPSSAWTRITGWTVRAGYPDTTIASSGIHVPTGTYAISAQIDYSAPFPLYRFGVRVTLDGTPIPALNPGATTSTTVTTTATVTVGGGLVQVEGYSSDAGATNRVVQASSTWLTIEKP